jgi:beta-galactosidase
VSFDRRVRKDSFYLYQANWSQQPVTHIGGRRHTERAYPLADVVVYSNASRTTLLLDDRELQSLDAAQCPLRVCTFRNVRLRPGANMLSALGRHGTSWRSDAVHWKLAPDNAENIYIAAGQLLSGVQSDDTLLGRHRFGSDNFFDGGEPSLNTHNGAVKGINEKAVPAEPRVWDQHRAGKAFGYRIPLPAGRYRVTLGFLSTVAAKPGEAGSVFDVQANGSTLITGLDLGAAAAEPGTAIARSFDIEVGTQPLHIAFNATAGLARVSNLSIVRQP